ISGLGTATLDNTPHDVPPIVNGSVTLTTAQLAGLTLHAADDDSASLTLSVQAHAAEGATTADSATQTIALTVNPVAEAPVLAASDALAASSSVNEDGSVALTITPHYALSLHAALPISISGLGTAT